MVRILNGIWNLKTQPFKTWLMATILSKTFEIWTKTSGFWMSRFFNGWDYSHSQSTTIWKLDHLKPDLLKDKISNVPDFEWSDFRSPLFFFVFFASYDYLFDYYIKCFLKQTVLRQFHNLMTSYAWWRRQYSYLPSNIEKPVHPALGYSKVYK